MQPNILMIVTDQQRRDTIGAYGSTIAQTPAVDRLAREGMTFDNAFTPCGLCSPTRSSMLTGVHPHTHEVLTNVQFHPVRNQLAPEQDILFRGLKGQGYRMGYVGKWHVNIHRDPTAFGCEQYVSAKDYVTYRREKELPFPPEASDYVRLIAAADPAPVEHSRPVFLADHAMRMMEEFSHNDEHPFFIRLDFDGPHPPLVVSEPYASMYDPASIPPLPNFADPLGNKPAIQRIKRKHWKTDEMSWADWQPLLARYYGMVSLIDAQVGRVLDKLDELGLCENTVVLYLSDHGDTMGSHNLWNKDYTMYDEIYRVPFIVRWPGVTQPGSRCDAYTHHSLDLAPTLLTIGGASVPSGLDGQTLVPLLHGQAQDRPREAFCQFHGCHMGLYSIRMLQTDRYKYIFHVNDIDELYDHENDPHELTNVAEDPAYAADLQALKLRVVDWLARTDDHLYNEWIVYWLTDDMDSAARAPGRTSTPMW